MSCANAYGYNWILKNGNNYSTAEELYNDAKLRGVFPDYIIPELVYADRSYTRDVSTETSINVSTFNYKGEISNNTLKNYSSSTVAPCFCVGSKGQIITTKRVSGQVNIPTSLFETNKDLSGLNVILDFDDSTTGESLIAKTDKDGQFNFDKVPIYTNVHLTVSGKGYTGVTDSMYVDKNIDNINIHATGPTLNGYS